MKRLNHAYSVLMALAFVMSVVMWQSGQEHLSDFWRAMYFLCADIILFVIVVGGWYAIKKDGGS